MAHRVADALVSRLVESGVKRITAATGSPFCGSQGIAVQVLGSGGPE